MVTRTVHPRDTAHPKTDVGDWRRLQQELAEQGQTLGAREALRKKELDALKEEGTLHSGVARQGLLKFAGVEGTGYRGEKIDGKRWASRFRREGNSF